MTPGADERAIEVMHREIASIPDVIAAQRDRLAPEMRRLVADAFGVSGAPEEVVVTGCGDSYFAGLASRLAIERYGGVRCRAVEALELARYEVRYVPPEPPPLLLAISYSGEVGRTIEAATTAAGFGWRTVAITGRAEGRLARASGDRLLLDVPTLGFSPGTSTYVAMLVALALLAAEIARARGRVEAARALDDALAAAPGLAAATLARSEEAAAALADAWTEAPVVTFLGAGPSKATAAFGGAKLFEGPQRWGVVQDLEEWAHEEYFVSGPRTPVTIVAPRGASADRARELASEMAFIGAPVALVTDEPPVVAGPEVLVVPIAAGLDEPLSPLLTCLPIALAAFLLAERLGTRSYGFPTPEREREHYETIHRATMGTPA